MTALPRTLRTFVSRLNAHLRSSGLKSLSYEDLGKGCGLSKSTVFALIKGTYTAKTKQDLTTKLHAHLIQLAQLHQMPFPPSDFRIVSVSHPLRQKAAKPAKPKLPATVRCGPHGYIRFNGRTYYCGPAYFGQVQVQRLPGRRDYAVSISAPPLQRIAYPIHPGNNQLGYQEAAS